MKKRVVIFLSMLMAVGLLAGCSGGSTAGVTQAPGEQKTAETEVKDTTEQEKEAAPLNAVSKGDMIGVSLTSRSAERWLRDGNTLNEDLTAAGYQVDLQYADSKPEMQVQQIENMILKGCKVLIVAPVDNSALSSVLATAKENGIVVINYDLGIVGSSDIDYFVGFDNSKVGTMQAEAIIEKLGLDKGEEGPFYIELVAGSLAEANCYMYFEGAMEAFKPYMDAGKLVVKSGQTSIEQCTVVDWKLELLTARLDNLLTTYYSDGTLLDAVLSPSDYLSGPIATRLESFGYGSADMPMPVITGNDATESVCKMIATDEVYMSVFKDTRLLSGACLDIINALAEGREPEVTDVYTPDVYEIPTIFVPMESITKENLKEVVVDSGIFTEEQIFGTK
ncbi:sugar-binding protein [Enterocloster asparagiformis]|uniref:substrate-binding domain-containing protein n=1 Tax=Enterocloster asparagiformis TaxID=333367 RepID=UPI000463A93D|nr:sugar-binding protein [Enterocloster asparagiformis]